MFTKNRKKLILTASAVSLAIVCLLALVHITSPGLVGRKLDFMNLHYFFTFTSNQSKSQFGLSPQDSDLEANAVILNSLVGTLVKTSPNGKTEAYLAESFATSEDGKVWRYKMRRGLTCDDGTNITAENFVNRLTWSLREYAKFTAPVDLEHLLGWEEFAKGGENLSGLRHDGDEVVFQFTTSPEALNELLRMPYFGFWCAANFDETGKWIQGETFVSSGAYSLANRGADGSVKTALRPEWFSATKKSPESVTFQYMKPAAIAEFLARKSDEQVMVHTTSTMQFNELRELNRIDGIPQMLSTMIINPRKQSGFDSIEIRRLVQQEIRVAMLGNSTFKSGLFYMTSASPPIPNPQIEATKVLSGKSITLPFRGPLSDRAEIAVSIVRRAIEKLGGSLQLEILDPNDPKTLESMTNPENFDLRLNAVGIGGHFLNSAIKMIFCTKLGVSYPDPSGRICNLVRKQEQIGGPIGQEYEREFNQILEEDASVIPTSHFGTSWLLSSLLEPSSIAINGEFPNLEDVRLK